jgi:Zinc carboxypeptidase
MSLIIDGNFDGGNPKEKDRIVQNSANEIIVYPFSEDDDPNYKFRLDLKIQNPTQSAKNISLTVDWQTERYMEYRDYIFLKNPLKEEWSFIPGRVAGTKSLIELSLKPGESYLCLHPSYSYEDYLRFIESVQETEVLKKYFLGDSREGRKIWAIKISDPLAPAKENMVVVARVHPYETSGSYCAEGIVESYRHPLAQEMEVLKKYNIYLIPMISPDGVYHGFGKLTSWQGVDLSKNMDGNDPSCVLLKNLIDALKPAVYMEFHNWMFKNTDGIYYLSAMNSYRFIRWMPSQKKYEKVWKPMLHRKILSMSPLGFKKYCKDRYQSICACFEYPWFMRDLQAMKAMGRSTILAISKL